MNLWEPSRCCCFQLRTGSIIIGFLFLIGGCLCIIRSIDTLVKGDTEIRRACEEDPDTESCATLYWNIELGSTCASLVIACFHIIFSSLLLYGIFKQKTTFFIPLIVTYVVQIGLMVLVAVLALAGLMYLGLPFVFIAIAAAIMGLLIFLETYFLLVLRAHYYEIQRAKGHKHEALQEETAEAPPYPGPHAPPSYPGPHAPPPYSTTEARGYPDSDALLYSNFDKVA